MTTTSDLVLYLALFALTFPYGYFMTRICAIAYFEQKLEYQRKFFKKFDIPQTTGQH